MLDCLFTRTGFVILALMAASAASVRAQSGVIAGSVAAAESGQPLGGATVVVSPYADSLAVVSRSTDERGRFRLDGLGLGRYRITVSYLGYATAGTDSVVLTVESPERELTVRLSAAPVELDAIEAEAERAPVRILSDRTVYSTKDMAASKGGSATDLLRQVPELEVDMDGNVKLRGNQSVAVHLNGRPAPMQGETLNNFLQQLPADRIASVEVMPNPSARHDPEGTGGIVNIVLAEDVDLGLSGNVSLRGGTRGSRGINGRLAWQKGRITLFGGGGINFGDNESDILDVRRNLLATPVTILEQQGSSEYGNTFRSLDFTLEYRLSERTTAWVNATGWGGESSNSTAVGYGLYDDARLVLDRYDRRTESEFDNDGSDVAAGLKHVFEPQRHELTVDLRRNGHGYGGRTFVEKLSMLSDDPILDETRDTDRGNDDTGTTLRVDYTRPLGEKGKIDVGLNIRRQNLDERSFQEITAFDGGGASDVEDLRFRYRENFNSLYVTAAQTFGDFGVQLGVRAELAETDFEMRTTGEKFANDYESLFPNVALTWTLTQGQTLRFNYSKRISRPWAGMLNPYVPADDPLNRNVGNPDLEPSYTHALSLDYSRIGTLGTLRIAPSYRRTVNGWESIKTVDANGVSTVTWQNTASTEYMGSNFTASLRPVGRFNGSVTLGLYRSITDASNISPEFSRDSWRWSLGGNATARVTSSLNMQLNANYSPAREVPQGRISPVFFSAVGLRQQLVDDRATVSLFLNDPLGLYEYRFETRDRTHVQDSRTSFQFRSATLSFTWNFGRPPQQVSRPASVNPQGTEDAIRIR